MSDKKKSSIDKLLLGAVIGAAVGSVIGASVAPNEGKQTRTQISGKIKELSSDVKSKVYESEKLLKDKKSGFLSKLINYFTSKNND